MTRFDTTITNWIMTCCEEHFLDFQKEVLGRSNHKHVSEIKHMIWYILRMQGFTFDAIGRYFRRNHTTILHGVKKIENQIHLYADVQEKYEQMISKLQEMQGIEEIRYLSDYDGPLFGYENGAYFPLIDHSKITHNC